MNNLSPNISNEVIEAANCQMHFDTLNLAATTAGLAKKVSKKSFILVMKVLSRFKKRPTTEKRGGSQF